MSDSTESTRQATHAKQEGVDDNVAALAGPVVDGDSTMSREVASASHASATEARPAPPPGAHWSSSVNAAPASAADAKPRGAESQAKWIAAAGIGSAALVAALLYANRGKREDRSGGRRPGGER